MTEKVKRVLLLHPEDSPWAGAWGRERWDLVVDLGFASAFTYEEWRKSLGAPVLSLYHYARQGEGYRWVNEVLEYGRGKLLDRMGLDWWELLAVWSYQELHALYLLDNFLRQGLPSGPVDLTATRSHLLTRILERALSSPVRYYQSEGGSLRRVSRMLRSARKLRAAQISEIAFDKWDPGYRFRRHFIKLNRVHLKDNVVLLPSTYSNVTRSELAYAAQLPEHRFLLAATRPSALPERLPENVTAAPLAAYAQPSSSTKREAAELRRSWGDFRRTTLGEVRELRHATDAGLWDYFPSHLENGLHLREAWRELLNREPVSGVLCGDDLNYYTRLPLLLAQRSGRKALYCSHGALDGGFLFKLPLADSFLVKGEMERDYLQRARPIAREKILVAAPGKSEGWKKDGAAAEAREDGALIFFSQPYEVEGGRADAIYRELLPHLFSAALRSNRKLIVKLHPFESKRARQALISSILPEDVFGMLEVVAGVTPEEVMSRAWCGVTVDSSVAVECALRKMPFFLCGWLDFGDMGYMQQLGRFGAGRILNSPGEIECLPELVANFSYDAAVLKGLWHEGDPAELSKIMFGSGPLRLDSCA